MQRLACVTFIPSQIEAEQVPRLPYFIAFGRYVLVAVLGLHTHTGEEFRAS
jgi:hypothetical protein